MENDISKVLMISDPDAKVTEFIKDDESMSDYVFMEKREKIMYCPDCGARMFSKGIRTKKINHPALQTGYKLAIVLTVRKWYCRKCGRYDHDHYSFVEDGKRNSILTPFLILEKFRDLEVTARHVAKELNVSDTYVFEEFMMRVNLPRLPFSEIISVDEVHMKFDKDNLYAIVIMDFISGQIIDILPNRHKETYDEYFLHITLEERMNVKVIISDIYKPYLLFPMNYFPDSRSIIDSFHVLSLILSKIKKYIAGVKRRYQERDDKIRQERNYKNNSSWKTMKKSREVKLLENYDWFMLKNYDDIDFSPYYRHIRGVAYWFNPRETEKAFMELDPNFGEIRDLKERYVRFNRSHINDVKGAEQELREIIAIYQNSRFAMFRDIAVTLKKHIPAIAESFTYIAANEKYEENAELLRRLSNSPIEGFNVNPKNLKRLSRGVSNYEYTRNRILWATRENPHILGVPRRRDEIHRAMLKKRGPYKKSNKQNNETPDSHDNNQE